MTEKTGALNLYNKQNVSFRNGVARSLIEIRKKKKAWKIRGNIFHRDEA